MHRPDWTRRRVLRSVGAVGVGLAAPGSTRSVAARSAGSTASDRAAEDWVRTFDERLDERSLGVVPGSDGGGLVVGHTIGCGTAPLFVSVAGDGTERWRRTLPGDDVSSLRGMAPGIGGGAVLTGRADDASQSGYLIRVADDGSTEWSLTLPFGERTYVEDAVRGAKGYLVGCTVDAPDERVAAAGVAPDGTELWRREVEGEGAHQVEGVVRDRPTSARPPGAVLVGLAGKPGVEPTPFAVAVDAAGQLRWRGQYGSEMGWFEGGTPTDDGYLLAGWQAADRTDRSGWLLHVGPDGTEQWSATFPESHQLYDAVPVGEGGGYVVAGTVTSSTNRNHDVYLAGVDGSGAVTWRRVIEGTDRAIPADLVAAGDGSFLLAGAVRVEGGNGDLMAARFGAPAAEGLSVGVEERSSEDSCSARTPGGNRSAPATNGSPPSGSGGTTDAEPGSRVDVPPDGGPTETEGEPTLVFPEVGATGLAVVGLVLDAVLIAVAWVAYRWYHRGDADGDEG